jgi:hypothetical protein
MRLVGYCFTSRSRIFHLYGDVTIVGEGLQNVCLCSALRALEQGGILAVTRDLGFSGLIRLTTCMGMWRTYSNPDPHGGTAMSDAGLTDRNIMYMSDHKCEEFLKSYCRRPSTEQKKKIISTVLDSVASKLTSVIRRYAISNTFKRSLSAVF